MFDTTRGMPQLTPRFMAERALQSLYDLTGYQLLACDAYITYTTENKMSFTFKRDNNTVFYTADVDTVTGRTIDMRFELSSETAIDITKFTFPDGIINYESAAKYFYEHSSFGDRRQIVRIEKDPLLSNRHSVVVKLFTENNDFFIIYIDSDLYLPYHLQGPYLSEN